LLSEDTLDYSTINYYRAAPMLAGFAPFTFPAGSLPPTAFVAAVAENSSPTRSAYIANDFTTGAYLATRGDLVSGSAFLSPIDITRWMGENPSYESTQTFAYDPVRDRAYMLVEDEGTSCSQQSPQLLTIDFTTGTSSIRQLAIGGGDPDTYGYQLALDPSTGVAAIATSCQYDAGGPSYAFRSQLSLLNLETGTTTTVFEHNLGSEQLNHGFFGTVGGASAIIGIDSIHHIILQRSMFCPDLVNLVDMNARPCLTEYDENGRLVKTEQNLFFAGFVDPGYWFNGVNGALRRGVAMGQQLPTIYIVSGEVQPYAY
jgi:hypothetical protein